ncbi:MAG: hypothetical protein WBA54_12335 [Acidaminobacteraceae bacterium]
MSKLLSTRLKKVMVLTLLLLSTTTMLSACTPKTEEAPAVETTVELEEESDVKVETLVSEDVVIPTGGEKLSEVDRILVDEMLKRMELAVNQSDAALYSEEFKLVFSDYTESQVNDIDTKLLAFVEEKHNFYFYDILNENVDEVGNKVIIVKMGYKNLDEKDETNEYVQMLVEPNVDGKMNISKIFFLNEDEYAPYKK